MMPQGIMRAVVLVTFFSVAFGFQLLRTPLNGAFAAQRHSSQLTLRDCSFRNMRRSSTLVMQQQTKQKEAESAVDPVLCTGEAGCSIEDSADVGVKSGLSSYADFAKSYPFANNIIIATAKTASADLIAQTVIGGTPISQIDSARLLLFAAFGAIYLGWFQYAYQVNVFKKLFDIDKFTSQSWADKLKDGPGLRALAAQTALDLTVLTLIYLPTFYIFKASVFSGSMDPMVWGSTGLSNYQSNFAKDELDLIRVWLPADLVCFSVPIYLRLPVRHVVSFVWTAYLSFARGGH